MTNEPGLSTRKAGARAGAARRRGRRRLTHKERVQAIKMVNNGIKPGQVAAVFECNVDTIVRIVALAQESFGTGKDSP